MWAVLAGGYFLMSFNRVSTAVLSESLTRAFDTTATQLGLLHSSFFYLYAGLQLPAGVLTDRYGPRHVATGGMVVMGVGAAGLALSDVFLAAFLSRALVGLGGSVIFLSILRFGVSWFAPGEFATLTGVTIGVSALGGIVATTPLAVAAAVAGWRTSMIGVAALCVALGAAIHLLVRNRPRDLNVCDGGDGNGDAASPGRSDRPGPTERSLRGDLRTVLGRADTWVLGAMMFLILGVNLTVAGLWAVPYIVDLYGTSVARASVFVLAGNLGLLVGSPLFGWVADRTEQRTGLVVLSTVIFTAAYGSLTAVVTPPVIAVGVVLFFAMFVNGGVSLAFTIARDRNPDEVSGSVNGAINSVGYAGAAVMPAVMGVVLDAYWTGEVVGGARVYSVLGYRVAFGIATLAGLAALACAVWLHRTA